MTLTQRFATNGSPPRCGNSCWRSGLCLYTIIWLNPNPIQPNPFINNVKLVYNNSNLLILCWVHGLYENSSCIKLRVYDYMGQPELNPFINRVKVSQPTLTWNMFTINPNPLIYCWVCVGFTGHVKHSHLITTTKIWVRILGVKEPYPLCRLVMSHMWVQMQRGVGPYKKCMGPTPFMFGLTCGSPQGSTEDMSPVSTAHVVVVLQAPRVDMSCV